MPVLGRRLLSVFIVVCSVACIAPPAHANSVPVSGTACDGGNDSNGLTVNAGNNVSIFSASPIGDSMVGGGTAGVPMTLSFLGVAQVWSGLCLRDGRQPSDRHSLRHRNPVYGNFRGPAFGDRQRDFQRSHQDVGRACRLSGSHLRPVLLHARSSNGQFSLRRNRDRSFGTERHRKWPIHNSVRHLHIQRQRRPHYRSGADFPVPSGYRPCRSGNYVAAEELVSPVHVICSGPTSAQSQIQPGHRRTSNLAAPSLF